MRALPLLAALALTACLGTTGNTLVRFRAAAAGPADAVAGAPLEFHTSLGWHVVLTTAKLHVGAMYLDETLLASGGGPGPCILTGTYVAQATTDVGVPGPAGIDVDLLSPNPQYFPSGGEGTDLPAKSGQVFLTGVQVDQVADSTVILAVEGTADRAGASIPFVANLTIAQNRIVPPSDSTKPGSNPICHERVVAPIVVNIVPRNGGTLLLRIDPRVPLFDDIDFSALKRSEVDPTKFAFVDDSSDSPSHILYQFLHSAGGSPPLYQFSWEDSPPP